MNTKKISPAVLPPLKEALFCAFWFKRDLRAYLTSCLPETQLISRLDWTDYKRNIIGRLIDGLAASSNHTQELLIILLATADISDPRHLLKVDGGQEKYNDAVAAIKSLNAQVAPYRKDREQEELAVQKRLRERVYAEQKQAVSSKLDQLKAEYYVLVTKPVQERGYALEKLLNQLFTLFDIDSKGPFRIEGEQIDGAFSFEGCEFILEAKWKDGLTPLSDLDVFSQKIERKLENTLGLFLSINGYQPTAVTKSSGNRPVFILMDGSDLMAILEARITFPEIIARKKQHASRTGNVYVPVSTFLS